MSDELIDDWHEQMKGKAMKKIKLSLRERIESRTDKKRPLTLKEFNEKFNKDGKLDKCFVLDVKLLTPDSSTIRYSWNEKDQS